MWLFAWSGIDALRRAISDERIECDLQEQDAMFVAAKPAATKVLAAEQAARAAGGFSSQLYSQSELSGVLGSAEYAGGLAFTGTFSIDGHRCCLGLRKGLLEAGVRIFEHSPVTQILRDGITTAAGSIRAEAVLVCADRFLPSLGLAPFEVYHAQTFLAISEPLRDSVRAIVFPDRPMMVWDTDLVYHYFRLTGDQRLLVGGGTLMSTYSRQEEHQPQKVTRRLSRYLTRHFPALPIRFAACWPGLIGISKDFGPVIGRHLDFPMVHFAGAGAGLPWAAALGGYLADRLIDKRCDLDEMLSDRRRFPVGRRVQRCLGKPATFALAHGMKKFAR